jgi:hypothetical protein
MSKVKNSGRVIISATCFADASSAIELATFLAKKLKLEIKAYFIEDESAFGATNLPFARATSITGGSSKVTHAEMRDAYLRDAKTYEIALSNAARTAALNWSFEQMKGHPETLLVDARAKGDLILFGFQKLQKQKGVIGVIQESELPNSELTKLGASLSRTLGLPLKTVTVPVCNPTEDVLNFLQDNSLTAIIMSHKTALSLGISTVLEAGRCPVIVYDTAA